MLSAVREEDARPERVVAVEVAEDGEGMVRGKGAEGSDEMGDVADW